MTPVNERPNLNTPLEAKRIQSSIPKMPVLLDLPRELLLQIIKALSTIDPDAYSRNLVPFSSKCSIIRELCAPDIFRHFRFTNRRLNMTGL